MAIERDGDTVTRGSSVMTKCMLEECRRVGKRGGEVGVGGAPDED